jgi:hypothetical protein
MIVYDVLSQTLTFEIFNGACYEVQLVDEIVDTINVITRCPLPENARGRAKLSSRRPNQVIKPIQPVNRS